MYTWYEPDYYSKFHCKCGTCRHSCCSGWQIQVNETEYFRLIGMNCSEELHHRIECAFAVPENPSRESFRVITPNWLGSCPMLDRDGLCMLQKECGADALPKICMLYPRSLEQNGGILRACCSGSCEAVVELLLHEERLTVHPVQAEQLPVLTDTAPENFSATVLRCLSILQERDLSLNDRITHIHTQLQFPNEITEAQIRTILPDLLDFSPELKPYLSAGCLESAARSCEIENLLANHLLYVNFPYTDSRIRPCDSIIGLSAALYLLQLVSHNEGDDYVDACAAVFHLTEHTAFYYNACVLWKHRFGEWPGS